MHDHGHGGEVLTLAASVYVVDNGYLVMFSAIERRPHTKRSQRYAEVRGNDDPWYERLVHKTVYCADNDAVQHAVERATTFAVQIKRKGGGVPDGLFEEDLEDIVGEGDPE